MFNTKIPLYGIFILLSILLGLIDIFFNLKKKDYIKEEKMAFILYIIIGTIFGAKMFTFYTNYSKYKNNFNFFTLGLSSYGALIGIFFLIIIFCLQFRKKIRDVFNIVITSIPLMYSIGKIGCFLAGCCYGIHYNGPFAITYKYSNVAPKGISLFPIQIVEAVCFLLLYIQLKMLYKKKKNGEFIIEYVIFTCGVLKFILDYFRFDNNNSLFSINQIFSLIFIIIAIISYFLNKYKLDCERIKCENE